MKEKIKEFLNDYYIDLERYYKKIRKVIKKPFRLLKYHWNNPKSEIAKKIIPYIKGFYLKLSDIVENVFRQNIVLISSALAIMGVLIYLGDKWASKHYTKETEFENISFKQALTIGLSQALAIIPGFSRSGTTILTARLMGLSKSAATKFTFLLSVPIIAGATILEIGNLELGLETFMGVFIAFVVGIFSIKFFW